MEKQCKKCGIKKSLDMFYKHSKSSDGVSGKCKECAKADARTVRYLRIDYYREYDRNRGNRQPREYLKEYRKKNPKKYKANCAINNALRSGKIKKLPCEICGSEKSVGHHDDYDKPMSVRWLCQAHHKQWHAANGEGKNG